MLRCVGSRFRKGVRFFSALPKTSEEWAKALTTPAPGVAATNKYAGMSVNAAYNLGALEPMRKDMQYLGSVFKDERTVQAVKDGKGETKDFVNDMNMMYQLSQATPEEKKKLQKAGPEDVKKALKKYPSFAPLTSQLLGSYMEEGVVLDLPAIAEEFEELASKVMREVKVEIVSAAPLSDRQKAQLLSIIQKYVDNDATLLLTEKVEANLIAGFQLMIGDRYVDLSAKKSVDSIMSKIPSA
ncbi:hypothetical protein AAMO2058_000436000 [Amorphochlora amoebiformis]